MPELFHADVASLAARVPSGASLILNKGEGPDVPMHLVRELIRRGVRDLRLVTLPTCAFPVSGMAADILIGAGCVAVVETSGISLGELGPAPRFTRAVKEGSIRVIDSTCPAIYAAVQAGAKGQPFAALRGLIGSDLLAHRDDYKVIPNPFDENDPVAVLKALNPEVAILHATLADSEGNVWIGRDRDRLFMAQASDRVLVTVEEIVDANFFDDEKMVAGVLPSVYVDAIAEVPGGAWPMGIDGRADIDAVADYAASARTDEGFAAWLEENVISPSRSAAE